jgi:trehalose synthase-fused probable maltokinase
VSHPPIRSRPDDPPTGAVDWPDGLEALAEAALPDFLLRQRWYPRKDAGLPQVRLSKLVPFPVAGWCAAVAVWRATPPSQAPLYLFIPLALVTGEGADAAEVIATVPRDGPRQALVEAFSLDPFVRAWVDSLFRDEGSWAAAGLRTGTTDHLPQARPAGSGWAVRRSNAEQSNTSIRIGETAILKVIRKLEDGVHPEVEVGRFLAEKAGFVATPRLLAWNEMNGATGTGVSTLSILQAFVPNQGDGWSWVLERLGRVAEPNADSAMNEATAWLRRVGSRTAEMHKAFGIGGQDPAFRPEQVGTEDVQRWSEAAHAMAQRALDGLAAMREQLDETSRQLTDRLLSLRNVAADRIEELRPEACFAKTRHHGDFHLGQILVAGEDAVIIDFEGEPMRPLAERRAKNAVLRDVAGMLRSLSYAAAVAGNTLSKRKTASDRKTARARLAAWEAKASRTFIDAYLEAAQGTIGVPEDRAESERVMRFFMLEKAFYEIAYELANRPNWVLIPLRGALALVDEGNS